MAKSNTPLVSIGIPFYNAQAFLAQAITSVILQSYKNWELFLIDDGSSDNSLTIAKKYSDDYENIHLICDGENKGLPVRLNELSKVASGQFYARMDADDMMHPDRLKIQVNYLLQNPNVDLCGSGLLSLKNDGQITGIRKGGFSDKFTLKSVLQSTWCVHPTITGKTSWFQENLYNEQMKRAQDYDLWIRTVEKSRFVRLNDALLFYREASTPSLKKYVENTNFSIRIFWKNISKIGFKRATIMTVSKLFKLGAYALLWMFGSTNKLIARRSVPLEIEAHNNFQNQIKNIQKIALKHE